MFQVYRCHYAWVSYCVLTLLPQKIQDPGQEKEEEDRNESNESAKQ